MHLYEVPGSFTQFSNITDSANLSEHSEHHIGEFLPDKHFYSENVKI